MKKQKEEHVGVIVCKMLASLGENTYFFYLIRFVVLARSQAFWYSPGTFEVCVMKVEKKLKQKKTNGTLSFAPNHIFKSNKWFLKYRAEQVITDHKYVCI